MFIRDGFCLRPTSWQTRSVIQYSRKEINIKKRQTIIQLCCLFLIIECTLQRRYEDISFTNRSTMRWFSWSILLPLSFGCSAGNGSECHQYLLSFSSLPLHWRAQKPESISTIKKADSAMMFHCNLSHSWSARSKHCYCIFNLSVWFFAVLLKNTKSGGEVFPSFLKDYP